MRFFQPLYYIKRVKDHYLKKEEILDRISRYDKPHISTDFKDYHSYISNTDWKDNHSWFNYCFSEKDRVSYFEFIFQWLNKCEEIFGFDLEGYGKIRMYTFLAERYLPYWFSKYTNNLIWPVIFYNLMDINNEK